MAAFSDLKDELNEEKTSRKDLRATPPLMPATMMTSPQSGEVVIEPRSSEVSFKPSEYIIDASMMQVPQSPASVFPEPREAP